LRTVLSNCCAMPLSCFRYDCGVSLPIGQRYTDWRYRRVAPHLVRTRLDQVEAVELVAILRILPLKYARFAFHWNTASLREAAKLLADETMLRVSEPFYRANLSLLSAETSLALINAMRDGGWTPNYGLPEFLRMAVLDLRGRGWKHREVADFLGISTHTTNSCVRSRTAKKAVGLVL
jgi:DNA-directed RNA polymerase specialized sigma24 family protein